MVERDFGKVAYLLKVLGDPSSLRILYEAKCGFKSGLQFARKLHLTPRKYYKRLRKLCDLGVLEHQTFPNAKGKEYIYVLTPLGKHIYEIIFNDIQSLVDGNNMKFDGFVSYSRMGVISNYEHLVKAVVGLVKEAKSKILLATRYLDLEVAQSLMQAVLRDIELKSITNKELNIPQFMKLIGGLTRNLRPSLLKIVDLAEKMGNFRIGNVPVSFIMMDGEIVVWELPTKDFEMAFISQEKWILEIFENYFWKLWKASSRFPIAKI